MKSKHTIVTYRNRRKQENYAFPQNTINGNGGIGVLVVPLISPRFHSIRFHVDSAPPVEFDFWEIELDEIFALAC